uniref:Uncharacterized protein n=1 Tax=Glossina brevipalpis TaxID=37001 RepID=A0A1A9X0U5_9MUSC
MFEASREIAKFLHCCERFWAAYVPCEAQHRDAVQLTLEQIDMYFHSEVCVHYVSFNAFNVLHTHIIIGGQCLPNNSYLTITGIDTHHHDENSVIFIHKLSHQTYNQNALKKISYFRLHFISFTIYVGLNAYVRTSVEKQMFSNANM